MWFLANMQYVTNKCKQKWLHHNSRVITRKMELFHLPCHFGAKFCTYIRINHFIRQLIVLYTFTCTPTPTHMYMYIYHAMRFISSVWQRYRMEWCVFLCVLTLFLYSELKSRLLSAITQQTNGCGCGYGYGSVHAKKIMAKMSMSFK